MGLLGENNFPSSALPPQGIKGRERNTSFLHRLFVGWNTFIPNCPWTEKNVGRNNGKLFSPSKPNKTWPAVSAAWTMMRLTPRLPPLMVQLPKTKTILNVNEEFPKKKGKTCCDWPRFPCKLLAFLPRRLTSAPYETQTTCRIHRIIGRCRGCFQRKKIRVELKLIAFQSRHQNHARLVLRCPPHYRNHLLLFRRQN